MEKRDDEGGKGKAKKKIKKSKSLKT